MTGLASVIKRNCKLFLRDKGMFFTALITPMILLLLYSTFLGNVFHDSFTAAVPSGLNIDSKLIDAVVAGQLIASLLAVSCVTVAFCANVVMVQDKAVGTADDLFMTPVRRSTLALGYYISTLLSSLAICLIALFAGLIYVSAVGWYMTVGDVLLMVADVFLLVMFGTALSSIINFFLSTQGQISAVGTIVSAGYGFICGAYMPISSFSNGLQSVLSFMPGTYGTSLLKNHALRGVFEQMEGDGWPSEVLDGIKASLDCTVKFLDSTPGQVAMYCVLIITVVLLVGIYIILNRFRGVRRK